MNLNDRKSCCNMLSNDEYGEFDEKPSGKILLRQILAMSASMSDAICSGIVSGLTSIILEQLNEPGSELQVTKDEGAWIASSAVLPMVVSCLVSGISLDKLGRRRTFLIASAISFIGWILLYRAFSLIMIVAGRIITGFSIGLMCPAVTTYLGEVGHPRYRGIIMTSCYIGLSIGVLLIHAIGAFVTWRIISFCTAMINLLNILAFLYLPDSHTWHFRRDEIAKGKRVFLWYRGDDIAAQTELTQILNTINNEAEATNATHYSAMEYLRFCMSKAFLKPLFVVVVFILTMQLSGNKAIMFYSISIVREIVPNFNEYVATVVLDITRLAFAILGCAIIKRYRVRVITMCTGCGAIVSLCGVALFRSSTLLNIDSKVYQIVSLVFLMGYIISLACGLSMLPLIVCGEVFPSMTRGLGAGISVSVYFLSFALLVKLIPIAIDTLGISGTFLMFAATTLIGTIVLYFTLPETKNKTLKEIEELFK